MHGDESLTQQSWSRACDITRTFPGYFLRLQINYMHAKTMKLLMTAKGENTRLVFTDPSWANKEGRKDSGDLGDTCSLCQFQWYPTLLGISSVSTCPESLGSRSQLQCVRNPFNHIHKTCLTQMQEKSNFGVSFLLFCDSIKSTTSYTVPKSNENIVWSNKRSKCMEKKYEVRFLYQWAIWIGGNESKPHGPFTASRVVKRVSFERSLYLTFLPLCCRVSSLVPDPLMP